MCHWWHTFSGAECVASSAKSGTKNKETRARSERTWPSNPQIAGGKELVAVRFCPRASTSRLGCRAQCHYEDRTAAKMYYGLRTTVDDQNVGSASEFAEATKGE